MNPLRILSAIGNWFSTFVDFLKEKNSFAIAFLIAIGAIAAEGYIIYVQDDRIQTLNNTIANFGKVLITHDSLNRVALDVMRDKFQSRLDQEQSARIKEQSESLRKFNQIDSMKNASASRVATFSTQTKRAKSNVADLKRKTDSLEKLLNSKLK